MKWKNLFSSSQTQRSQCEKEPSSPIEDGVTDMDLDATLREMQRQYDHQAEIMSQQMTATQAQLGAAITMPPIPEPVQLTKEERQKITDELIERVQKKMEYLKGLEDGN